MLRLNLAAFFLAYCNCVLFTTKSQLSIDVVKSFTPKVAYKLVHFYCNRYETASFVHKASLNGFYAVPELLPSLVIPVYTPYNALVYVIDLTCNDSLDTLKAASVAQLYSIPFRWVLISDSTIKEEQFHDLNMLVDSKVILCTLLDDQSYEISIIYKRKENYSLIYEHYGNWTNGKLTLKDGFDTHVAVRRQNLKGTNLNVCMVITENDTYKHLTDRRDKHIEPLVKVNYVFMLHLQNILNSTMHFEFVSTWGYKDNDSNWSGMIGKLNRKKADIGTALFMTRDRVPIIEYIAMTTKTKSKFIFRQPKLSYITNVFTLPFNNNVWISCIVLVTIMTLGLYFVIKWEWAKKRIYGVDNDEDHLTDTELQDSFLDILVVSVAAVCQQGTNAIPYNSAGRIIILLLYISLMFLYTSYSANIVALLQSSSTSIQTLNDLLKSRLTVGVDDTVFNHFYFPHASEPVRSALYLQKVIPPGQAPHYYPIEEGIKKLRQGLFAFHVETGAGYKIIEDEKCGLEEISFLQVPDPYLAIRKNSSYKEMMKIAFRKIYETGIQEREVSLIYTKKPPCISRGSSFIGVGIVDCYPAAMVFAIGIIGSAIVLCVEFIFYKVNRNSNNHNKKYSHH